ncbi:hypothetical protein L1D14_22980 [Vibrio tubiashii]|uniref:hypothetical protein n=1 Tax=Vibrio tubiashii TaxID=29498 RepID=UPI001EFD34C2|nr:hypothetical protein [Vibrio tubiashii]MCG9579069.1 hypothetical protein [Vibrio tubiashii]
MEPEIHIVDRKSGKYLRTLTDRECQDLSPENLRTARGQQLLQMLNTNGYHLSCQCTRPAALMFTRHYTQNTDHYGLVCHAVKGLHSENCHHFRVISGAIIRNPKGVDNAIAQQMESFDELSLLSEFAKPSKKNHDNQRKDKECSDSVAIAQTGAKVPSLVNLTRYLIKQSNQNVILSKDYWNQTPIDAIKMLIDAAKSISFGEDDNSSSLRDWMFWGDKGHKFACSRLYRVEEAGRWRKGSRPHALVVSIADQIELEDSSGMAKWIKLDGGKPIYLQRVITEGIGVKNDANPSKGGTEGPFLVVYTVARPSKDRKFQGHTAFIKPIVSQQQALPVDSGYERNFAKRAIYHLLRSHKPTCFTKPLEGIGVNGSFLLPDFLLEIGNEKHLIEIMGMLENPAYAARKEFLLPLMKDAWPDYVVFELDPRIDEPYQPGNVSHYIHSILQSRTK